MGRDRGRGGTAAKLILDPRAPAGLKLSNLFAIDPTLTHVDATREQVVAIIESVNQPQVGIPGKSPQVAQAFVTGVRNSNTSFSIYVYLLLRQEHEAVIFIHPRGEFPLEAYREIESEALHFVESMGFMMENVNFRNQSTAAQDELMTRLPVFMPIEKTEGAEPDAGGDGGSSQKLARLLGAF